MIRLFLVRHGNTFEADQVPTQVGAATDLPLTSTGRAQAQLLADHFKKINPVAIYSGSLKRQMETAEIIACGKKIINEPALTEIDYGPWEGLTSEEILAKWQNEYANWTKHSLWPENIFKGSLQNHLLKITKWLHLLRQKYSPGDSVIGITSNGLIRLFYSLVSENGMKPEDLKVKTGNFCELYLFPDSIKIKSWNKSSFK